MSTVTDVGGSMRDPGAGRPAAHRHSAAVTGIPASPARLGHPQAGRAVVAFGVLVVAMLWGAIAWDLWRERIRALAAAEADTANLARVFEEHIQRTVDGLDQTLLHLKAEFERDPRGFRLNEAIANNIILKRVSVQIAVIDADGLIQDSNVPGFPRISLADREHFRVHREATADRLFISQPVVGRISGRWSVQLTRRLDGSGGSFAGVLVVSLNPHYLAELYGSVDIGSRGGVMLVGSDGVVRAHSDTQALGRKLNPPGMVDELFAGRAGSHRVKGPFDHQWRIASFRALDNLPLAVWVGRSEAEVLTAHRQVEAIALLVGGGVTAVLGAALIALYVLVRRQQAIAHDLAVKKAELVAGRERLKRYVADLERVAEVAAHDLQEPLRRVVAYAQLLSRHTPLDEVGRDYLGHVVAGAQRIRKLVQDLEAFVAVDHLPPAEGAVPAGAALSSAAERLADEIRAADVTLVSEPLPTIAADERSLTEIFTQLLDNAIRYRASGRKPRVEVSARREGGLAVFAMRDNGIGIEPRDRLRLFEVFHRLHGVDAHSGTGIGLAIVRRMVERLGGRLWVESEPGQGSTFSFSLPLAPELIPNQEVRAA